MTAWFRALEFREPWFLLILFAAIPIYFIAQRASGRVVFSSIATLPVAAQSLRARLAWLPSALFATCVALLVIALAGPRIEDRTRVVHGEGIAIMMVVDVSPSMCGLDLDSRQQQTRLDVVKRIFRAFVMGDHESELPGRSSDKVGLVSFAKYADARVPLTLDHQELAQAVEDLQLVRPDSRESGTAIGEALALAVARLGTSDVKSRVVILLTDGMNTERGEGVETPETASQLAEEKGVKVYTIGAGTEGLVLCRLLNPRTKQMETSRQPFPIDEDTLKTIAERTGGQYFRATNANGLVDIYKTIDRLETTRLKDQLRSFHRYYSVFLLLGLLVGCLGWLLRGTVFRRLPC